MRLWLQEDEEDTDKISLRTSPPPRWPPAAHAPAAATSALPAPRLAPPRPAPLARNPAPSRGSYLSENLRRKILSPAEARRCLPTEAFCSRSVLLSTPHPPHARMHFYSVPWTPTEIEMSQPKLSNPFSTSWQDHTAETGDLSHVFQIYRNSNCIRRRPGGEKVTATVLIFPPSTCMKKQRQR